MASASENDASKKALRARSSITLTPGWGSTTAASLPRVLAGFAANLRLCLRPDKSSEAFRNARHLDEVVRHIDKKLKGQAESIFDEPRGENTASVVAKAGIAMADGAVAQLDGAGGGDQILARVAGDGERNEVVGTLAQRGGKQRGDSSDEPLNIAFGDAGFAPDGVMMPLFAASIATWVATLSAAIARFAQYRP